MQKSRHLLYLSAFAASALLAACGGGGGGGGSTIPNPGGPNPGPTPTTQPTTQPTPQPTAPPTATPAPITASSSTVEFANAGAYGNFTKYGTEGPFGGESGASSNSGVFGDGVSCAINGSDAGVDQAHHTHSWVGIWDTSTNKQGIVPLAVGIYKPLPPNTSPGGGYPPIPDYTYGAQGGGCLYTMHTHDESGTIHSEPILGASGAPGTYPGHPYSLGDFLSVAALSGAGPAGSFPLPTSITVYAGVASSTPDSHGYYDVTSYTYVSNAASLSMANHTAVWLVLGSPAPTSLPMVSFVNQ